MALVADRVRETSTTTGTGTLNLAGAVTGRVGFVAGIGTGNTTLYVIENEDVASEWEIGIGTVTDATPDTLSRTTIIASSNAGAAVNFSAGTKQVFVSVPSYLLAPHVRTVTDNYTGTAQDDWILVNVSTAKTITLPTAAASLNGKRMTITRIAASSVSGKTTLSGVANGYALYEQYASAIVECDGTTWYVIAAYGQTGTGDDADYEFIEEFTVGTTNATETTAWSLAMADEYSYQIEVSLQAVRTGGTAGSDGQSMGLVAHILARRFDTGVAISDVTYSEVVKTDWIGTTVTADVSTNTVRLRVTGLIDVNITWTGRATVRRRSF